MVLLIPLVCVFAMIFSKNELDIHRTPEKVLAKSLYLPDGKILRIVSLGFNSLLADIFWIKSVLYFGQHTLDHDNPFNNVLRQKQGLVNEIDHNHEHDGKSSDADGFSDKSLNKQIEITKSANGSFDFSKDSKLSGLLFNFQSKNLAPYIYPLLRRVVELNPHFIAPYEFGGITVLMDSGEIDEAFSILEFGLQHNPERWEFPFYLGYIELFYRGNNDEALKWLSRAMLLPDRPRFIRHLYFSLLQGNRGTQITLDFLKGLHESSQNAKFRQEISELIEKLHQITN